MSTQYTTEPPPTASVLLSTSAGPLTLSIFATQTPLASRNFLQHVLDGTYEHNIFHRISPGFVIQTGDPTGTGSGGTSIYEDRDSERYDSLWARELGREVGEKILFRDEIHSRLKFNRRGLVGMAKAGEGDGEGGYGSQFFITLGDCRRELDGKCTMIGRVEDEGIYNVVKIAEGELVDGTERAVYPERILRAEVLEMPKGEAWQSLKKRKREITVEEERPKKMAKREKKKGGKALLSFGDEEEAVGVVVRPKKAKFNTALIDGGDEIEKEATMANGMSSKPAPAAKRKERSLSPRREVREPPQPASPSASRSPEISQRRKPSFHEPTTQLPIRDPEIPSRSFSRSPEPEFKVSKTKSLNDEIAALKASMRRDTGPAPEARKKKSALEQMIPATSTRGRKRPRPGDTSSAGNDANALRVLNAFKARLDGITADRMDVDDVGSKTNHDRKNSHADTEMKPADDDDDDEEAALCDLHFIVNCQSCAKWVNPEENGEVAEDDDDDSRDWMGHALSFEKDRLGKDLTWRKKGEEELVVIDPREKDREIKREQKEKRKGKGKA